MANDYTDELMEEMGRLQENWTTPRGTPTRSSSRLWRCAGPPADEPVTNLFVASVAGQSKLLLSKLRPVVARRADQPPRRGKRVEQHLASYPGAILAVTHDRFLDNVAEWTGTRRPRLPLARATTGPICKAERSLPQGREAKKRLTEELAWVRSKARQAARACSAEEMAAEAEKTRKLDFEGDSDPGQSPPRATWWLRPKGYDGRAPTKDLSSACPAMARRRHRGPTG